MEGDVTVTPDGGKPVRFGVGDLVVFPQGMSCTWEVHKAVRKHYRFDDQKIYEPLKSKVYPNSYSLQLIEVFPRNTDMQFKTEQF